MKLNDFQKQTLSDEIQSFKDSKSELLVLMSYTVACNTLFINTVYKSDKCYSIVYETFYEDGDKKTITKTEKTCNDVIGENFEVIYKSLKIKQMENTKTVTDTKPGFNIKELIDHAAEQNQQDKLTHCVIDFFESIGLKPKKDSKTEWILSYRGLFFELKRYALEFTLRGNYSDAANAWALDDDDTQKYEFTVYNFDPEKAKEYIRTYISFNLYFSAE